MAPRRHGSAPPVDGARSPRAHSSLTDSARPASKRRSRGAVRCSRLLGGSVDHRRHKPPRAGNRASAFPSSRHDVGRAPQLQTQPDERLNGARGPRCTPARPSAPSLSRRRREPLSPVSPDRSRTTPSGRTCSTDSMGLRRSPTSNARSASNDPPTGSRRGGAHRWDHTTHDVGAPRRRPDRRIIESPDRSSVRWIASNEDHLVILFFLRLTLPNEPRAALTGSHRTAGAPAPFGC